MKGREMERKRGRERNREGEERMREERQKGCVRERERDWELKCLTSLCKHRLLVSQSHSKLQLTLHIQSELKVNEGSLRYPFSTQNYHTLVTERARKNMKLELDFVSLSLAQLLVYCIRAALVGRELGNCVRVAHTKQRFNTGRCHWDHFRDG